MDIPKYVRHKKTGSVGQVCKKRCYRNRKTYHVKNLQTNNWTQWICDLCEPCECPSGYRNPERRQPVTMRESTVTKQIDSRKTFRFPAVPGAAEVEDAMLTEDIERLGAGFWLMK